MLCNMPRWIYILAVLLSFVVATYTQNIEDDTGVSNSNPCNNGFCNEGRTFGVAKRRMAFFMLPVMFKLGVIVTLLVGLTVLAFKGLTIGVILLIIAFGGIFSKLKVEHSRPAPGGGPVHLHVHDFEHGHKSYPSSSYGQWDRSGASNAGPADGYEFLGRRWQKKY